MASTGFQTPPTWDWPADLHQTSARPSPASRSSMPGSFQHEEASAKPSGHSSKGSTQADAHPQTRSTPRRRTYWPPRTCRICLETVNPTFHPPAENIPGIFQPAPSVTYDSSDPEAGRLLRPCKCKGSSKYVHEGCLQAWRHADPDYSKRNYWQCPTCGFRYRLERMQWGRWVSSTATQITVTITIFLAALFVMGFVADPIINLYSDPYGVMWAPAKVGAKIEPILTDDDVPTWTEHFIKGLAATGVLGFVKVLFAIGPWQYWNVRGSGIVGGGTRSGNTGRDRVASISWIVVVIGVVTFLVAVYKAVRLWSRRTLQKAGEKVMDVPGDDDDDEDEDNDTNGRNATRTSPTI